VQAMGVPWPTALGLVFLSGCLFLILTLAGIRQLIISAIPRTLFSAIAAGIGLFIALVGLRSAGLVSANPGTIIGLGDLHSPTALLALLGLAIIAVLQVLKVRGGLLLGILLTTALGWALGLARWTPQAYSFAEMTATAFRLDVPGALGLGGKTVGLALVEILLVFLFVDLFDNVGTLVAVSKRAGLVQADGTIPRLNRILFADAGATIVGSMAGTSTVVSYIESAAGVAAGGRTGLTAIVVGLLFLLTLFVAPWAQAVPAAATAPALVLVGSMMMSPLTEIDWDDPVVAIPAFLTVVAIPFTFSIANGLAFGVVTYALLKLVTRRLEKSDWLLFLLAALFIVRFVVMATE